MKRFLAPLLLLLFTSCGLFEEESKDYDLNTIEELLFDINQLAESKTCTNPNTWKLTPIGSKACGGPTGYLAYSSEINESEFLDLVEQYTKLQMEYNLKNNIASDCMYMVSPIGITCENGKPVFIY